MARLKIIFWISTLDFHLGVELDSTLTIVNNEKISLFRQLIQDIQSILINKLSFLVSMARLGEAIKCYSFQSWPLEPILRDPLCIMKMVHMMIKKDLIHFKSFVFFDVFTSYSRAGESVSAWQRR